MDPHLFDIEGHHVVRVDLSLTDLMVYSKLHFVLSLYLYICTLYRTYVHFHTDGGPLIQLGVHLSYNTSVMVIWYHAITQTITHLDV